MEDVELIEELPRLVEWVEGGVGPAPEEQEAVLVNGQAGAGLRAGICAHRHGPAGRERAIQLKMNLLLM